MILRVSSLNAWIDKDFIKEFFNKGCESLNKVYMILVKPSKIEIKNIIKFESHFYTKIKKKLSWGTSL